MAFLNFKKKEGELPSDIDLDMPPEPPAMMGEENSTEEPIDEELMMVKPKKVKAAKVKKEKAVKEEEIPELPPLPEIEEDIPKMPNFLKGEKDLIEDEPTLPEEDLELPPPPTLAKVEKEKKGLFSFFKPKKAAEKLPLPDIGEELPPLPGEEELPPLHGEEFPEIPPLPKEELPPLPKEEIPPLPEIGGETRGFPRISAPLPEISAEPVNPVVEKPVVQEEAKIEGPVKGKKFVTINDFNQVQGNISDMKGILKEADSFFVKLDEVKDVEDNGYKELYSNLQDIQKKLMFVDKVLFKEEST